MLTAKRFRRLLPCVYAASDYEMSLEDWIRAALLASPDDARISHVTRLQRLGLDFGPLFPIHLTRKGELHRVSELVFLHRTIAMPPHDDENVSVEAAYIGFAAEARTIDLIKVGDWLVHRGHLDVERLRWLAHEAPWRPGSAEALSVSLEFDGKAASPPESEVRVLCRAAGLPEPEVNADIYRDGIVIARGDLVFRRWKLICEYEGRHHLTDVRQWNRDITRYADLRALGYEYLQITHEMLQQPKALVLKIYQLLVKRGYDGPPPHFGGRWRRLFEQPHADRRFVDA